MRRDEREARRLVAQRSGGRCERCGRYGPTTMHHRVKRSHGGPWSLTNITAVCGSGTTGCHGWIESHPRLAREEGFALKSWEDPATVPVLLYRRFSTCFTPDEPSYTDQRLANYELEDWHVEGDEH
ncbi:HNH endonuclease [Mycolicibacterium palauense]|uniref:HNH endonuclease n=1 Tax=Mycolicibacterium palauense TaxID=2034511 RepID=UPI0038993E92